MLIGNRKKKVTARDSGHFPVASNGKESRTGSAQEQNKEEGNTLILIFVLLYYL